MGHYYGRDGSPQHFAAAGGGPTTLREARKLALVPSVTEVLQILNREPLNVWKRKQAVLSALTLGRLPDEPDEAFLARIDADASRQAQEAADHGTAIHAAIEASFRSERVPDAFSAHVSAVRSILADNFPGVDDWVIEQRFAHPSGFGGCVDIHSRSANVIGDHKSTAIAPDERKRLDYEQNEQLAAYAIGLGMPNARAFNLFISRTHPGHVRFHEWTPAKMAAGAKVFTRALEIWKVRKDYDGGWA